MPIKPIKLEMGEFTEEDKERMWETFRKVWAEEKREQKEEQQPTEN